jgi:hypothetical protein
MVERERDNVPHKVRASLKTEVIDRGGKRRRMRKPDGNDC